ncbi:MAG: helix-turn-helix domain-containing protein [Sphaerochaetaceae bacterium]|nr:helix-turn-helix domain-containing protein [Sphaerochaetaceae bacterium]
MKKEKSNITSLLAFNIKEQRTKKGFTQSQLAEKIGISVRHMSDIERADTFPSPEVIENIASVFKVPSYTLFLPNEMARKELLLMSEMKMMLDKEIGNSIEKVFRKISAKDSFKGR